MSTPTPTPPTPPDNLLVAEFVRGIRTGDPKTVQECLEKNPELATVYSARTKIPTGFGPLKGIMTMPSNPARFLGGTGVPILEVLQSIDYATQKDSHLSQQEGMLKVMELLLKQPSVKKQLNEKSDRISQFIEDKVLKLLGNIVKSEHQFKEVPETTIDDNFFVQMNLLKKLLIILEQNGYRFQTNRKYNETKFGEWKGGVPPGMKDWESQENLNFFDILEKYMNGKWGFAFPNKPEDEANKLLKAVIKDFRQTLTREPIFTPAASAALQSKIGDVETKTGTEKAVFKPSEKP